MAVGGGGVRSFLFLQGLATPFFFRLGQEIARRGHTVHRINLCGGDRLFWPSLSAVDFRGTFPEWRSFIGSFLHEKGVTDIVLFGDCRSYHRVAIDVARSRGIEIHVFEEGYFRPDWITLEKSGTNAFSGLPRDAETLLARSLSEKPAEEERTTARVGGGFSKRVCWEFLNQCMTVALTFLFPHYQRHRVHHPAVECCGWAWRLLRRPYERWYARRITGWMARRQTSPFYLLPLQLETDYQIRSHSSFASMEEVMRIVMESFAAHAPGDALLLIKQHPLDNGLVNYRRAAKRLATSLGLARRVYVVDGGHLPTLLANGAGVVTVNSTTGLQALHHNCRLKVLGRAVFDIPGLTFQGALDSFWREAETPDPEIYRAFRSLVMRAAQINGSFFTRAGMTLAYQGVMERMGVRPVAPQPAAASLPSYVPPESSVEKPVRAVHTARAA